MTSHSTKPANGRQAFDVELWRKLEQMQLDTPGADLTFTRRLARDNGWSLARARHVVEEYKRFLYLAARAGHPVTPSDDVDQAWHLHLVYTRHYWQLLCRDILGFELHHGPTLGGGVEQAKFGNWYARTLESYGAAFGQLDASIWPSVEQRFARLTMQRVDVGGNWVIPKPWVAPRGTAVAALAVLLVFWFGSALVPDGAPSLLAAKGSTSSGTTVLMTLLAVFVVIWLIGSANSGKQDDKNKKDGGGGCGGCGGSGCGGCGG